MNKRAIIVALVGLNLLLAGGLILTAYDLPKAHAQAIGRSANYIMVSGEIQQGNDAVYVMDLDKQLMTVVFVDKSPQPPPRIAGVRPGPDFITDLRQPAAQPPPDQRRPRRRR